MEVIGTKSLLEGTLLFCSEAGCLCRPLAFSDGIIIETIQAARMIVCLATFYQLRSLVLNLNGLGLLKSFMRIIWPIKARFLYCDVFFEYVCGERNRLCRRNIGTYISKCSYWS